MMRAASTGKVKRMYERREESPSRYFAKRAFTPTREGRRPDLSSMTSRDSLEGSEGQVKSGGKVSIASMANWIENVGKPAIEDHDILVAKLREKENEWRRAMLELQCLKEENDQLKDNLQHRPSNKEHETEKIRVSKLQEELQTMETHLQQKERSLDKLSKETRNLSLARKHLSANKENLSKALTKVTQDFCGQLQKEKSRAKRLEDNLLQKTRSLEKANRERLELQRELMSERQRANQPDVETLSEGCQTPRPIGHACLGAVYPDEALRTPSDEFRSTPHDGQFESWRTLAAEFIRTPHSGVVTPARSIHSEPSFCESVGSLSARDRMNTFRGTSVPGTALPMPGACETPRRGGANGQLTAPKDLGGFLQTLTRLSSRLAEVGSDEPSQAEGVLSTFQDEIQKCIESWSCGELPHEEIFALMERVFEEWASERVKRITLENSIHTMKREHQSLVRRVCQDLYNTATGNKAAPSLIMWIPMRIAGWLFWVPVRISFSMLSFYMNIFRYCMRTAGFALTRAGKLITFVGQAASGTRAAPSPGATNHYTIEP